MSQGRVLLPPLSPDLPYYRVQYLMSLFNTTVLDFAGSLYLKDFNGRMKVYILPLSTVVSSCFNLSNALYYSLLIANILVRNVVLIQKDHWQHVSSIKLKARLTKPSGSIAI